MAPTKPSIFPYSYYFASSWLTQKDGSIIDDLSNVISDRIVYPKFVKNVDKEYEFGSYPQSKVTDDSLISTLNGLAGDLPTPSNKQSWTDYGYYIESTVSSFMWYQDVINSGISYRGVYFSSYRPNVTILESNIDNTYQDDNGYSINNVYWFKFEPILWKVLTIDSQNNKAFLMSNIVLDSQDYYFSNENRTSGSSTIYPNNYKESHIRSWLNKSFYDASFTATEKNSIITSSVDNSPDSTGIGTNKYACENTEDKVFLASYADMNNEQYGFSSSNDRIFKASEYAKSQGTMISYNESNYGCGNYLLRSPNFNSADNVKYVNSNGSLGLVDIRATLYGMKPALWISF